MSRSLFWQAVQLSQSITYDDTVAAGSTMESGAANAEDDFNSLRSQVKRVLGQTNWYDALGNRSLSVADTDIDALENKIILCSVSLLTDVTVTASQNWELLVVASSETPTEVAAVGATTEGAIVAQSALNGAGFDVAELIEVAGASAISPLNLLVVVDSSTGQPLQSAGRDIFGLLQYESTGADGGAFNDTSAGARAKISFVRRTVTFNDLEACPVADIAGKTIRYNYNHQVKFINTDRDCFNGDRGYVDQAASVDVTRENSYDNQGTTVVTPTLDSTLDLAAGKFTEWGDSASVVLWKLTDDVAGSATTALIGAAVDVFDVNALVNNFDKGISAASGGVQIDVGITAGYIESTGSNDLGVRAAGELFLDDTNQPGSWAQTGGVKLSETATEWSDYETAFGGEVSLMNAAVQAFNNGGGDNYAVVYASNSSAITAGTNITGAGGTPNIDAQLADYSALTFVDDVQIFVQGQLQRPHATTSTHDTYPGTTPANGDIKLSYALPANSNVAMVTFTP